MKYYSIVFQTREKISKILNRVNSNNTTLTEVHKLKGENKMGSEETGKIRQESINEEVKQKNSSYTDLWGSMEEITTQTDNPPSPPLGETLIKLIKSVQKHDEERRGLEERRVAALEKIAHTLELFAMEKELIA